MNLIRTRLSSLAAAAFIAAVALFGTENLSAAALGSSSVQLIAKGGHHGHHGHHHHGGHHHGHHGHHHHGGHHHHHHHHHGNGWGNGGAEWNGNPAGYYDPSYYYNVPATPTVVVPTPTTVVTPPRNYIQVTPELSTPVPTPVYNNPMPPAPQ